MQFYGDDGVAFCRRLVESLSKYDDATPLGPGPLFTVLSRYSPKRHCLQPNEVIGIVNAVNWLQVRRHLVADEYNGTMFVVEFDGALVQCETNPVTIDLRKARVGEAAVDVTDIVRASRNTLDGGVAAIRAAADHARGRRT